jgi:hypothetical protein
LQEKEKNEKRKFVDKFDHSIAEKCRGLETRENEQMSNPEALIKQRTQEIYSTLFSYPSSH